MVDMEQFAFFVLEVYAFACFKIFLVRLKVICFWSSTLFCTLEPAGASRVEKNASNEVTFYGFNLQGLKQLEIAGRQLACGFEAPPFFSFRSYGSKRKLTNARVASDIPRELNKWSGFGCPVSDSLAITAGSITKQP